MAELPRRQLLLGLAAGALGTAAAQPLPLDEGKAGGLPRLGSRLDLPNMALLDGDTFKSAQAQGQILVLYWWASWCPFCAEQTPLMERLWQTQRGRGLQLLGLSIDKQAEHAVAYRSRRGYRFPSAWVSPALAQALPKPRGLPVTVVRGRNAQVLMAEAGQLFPEDIEQIARFL